MAEGRNSRHSPPGTSTAQTPHMSALIRSIKTRAAIFAGVGVVIGAIAAAVSPEIGLLQGLWGGLLGGAGGGAASAVVSRVGGWPKTR